MGQGGDETPLITNNFKKSLKQRESQRTREGRIIRDRMKLTEMQTEIHKERVEQNLGEMQFGEKNRSKVHRE